jgi:hypothetical protein
MSTVEIGGARETTAESLPELAAGLAVVVLTILGLASVSPTFLVQIAAVLCCVDLFPRRAPKALEFRLAFFRAPSQDRRRRALDE